MKLGEYLKNVRKSNALSSVEVRLFGFDNMKKGWAKRYADFEVTEDMLSILYHAGSTKKLTTKTKRRLLKIVDTQRKYEVSDNKLLYLMKNSHGDLKIGISVDPLKRARALTTGSGTTTICLAAWELEKNSRVVESQLHKVFGKYRKEGEWFTPRAFSVSDLENKIPCSFKRVYISGFEVGDSRVETEEYEFLHIKHETTKASLFMINGTDVWVPKSKILKLNIEKHLVTVPVGQISSKFGNRVSLPSTI